MVPAFCARLPGGFPRSRASLAIKIPFFIDGKNSAWSRNERGGTLENAQAMAAHESPRTTKLYDRTGDQITLDEVERISI